MSETHERRTDLAFTPSVEEMQTRLGSRERMERLADSGRWQAGINDNLAAFLKSRTTVFFGTASADGRPYIQHRGGEAGFIEIIGERTVAFADYPGNEQYISLGNLAENDRAFLFLIDYETQSRIKLWGRAKVVNVEGPDRAIHFEIEAWDINCRKYIPEMYSRQTVEMMVSKLTSRVAELESELAALRAAKGG